MQINVRLAPEGEFPFLTNLQAHKDSRGSFVKIFDAQRNETSPKQVFWTTSQRGTFRGMHFQAPPYQSSRLIGVVSGTIRDYVLDINKSSPDYGSLYSVEIESGSLGIKLDPHYAHGFETLSEQATVVYCQSESYSIIHDTGINIRSLGVNLQSASVTMSERDKNLPEWSSFVSPFGRSLDQ